MIHCQEQNPGVKFSKGMACVFALFVALTTSAVNASEKHRFPLGGYVDAEGNVLFQKPLNRVQSRAFSNEELAILRLEAEYQAAIDDAADEGDNITERLEDWVNLWTEDGTYISDLISVVAGFGAVPPDIVEDGNTVRGHDNLRVLLAALENAGVNGKRHLLSGVRVQFISPRLAIGQSEFAIAEATVVPAVVIATGRYHSVYQKVGDKWLFKQRKQDVDPAWGPAADPPQFINSIQDLVNDLMQRVEKLEAQSNAK